MRRCGLVLAFLATFFVGNANGQTWCGKAYMANETAVPPGGQFAIPTTSTTPLLALRFAPAIKPYLAEDANTPASFVIDTPVTYAQIAGTTPITLAPGGYAQGSLEVAFTVNGRTLARGQVPLNATKAEVPFSLAGLQTQVEPYNVTCSATYSAPGVESQTFTSSASLLYLPNPTNSSVTKMDLRTGALLAKPANGSDGPYETVFPIGFYTSFDGYLASNLSVLNELKMQGFTVVHPVPTFDNLTALGEVLDRMQEVGLYLMYDMRFTYMNLTSVTEQVNMIKSRPNLLLWYTGDEPDGTSDPLNATAITQELIQSLDTYNHPVSLVLNCQNYYWTDYTAGADIVMQDTYMISNNVTWSLEWNTPCNLTYGCCGCDDCKGNFYDISTRMDEFAYRLEVEGWERTKAVWTVPQAFGADGEYWPRAPTGQEYVVQSILGINHGGLGVVAWDDPTPADIKTYASILAMALPTMKDFILSPSASFQGLNSNGIDVGLWTVGAQTLLVATNTNYATATLSLSSVPGYEGDNVTQVLDTGSSLDGTDSITFESTGSGAFVLPVKLVHPRQSNAAVGSFFGLWA